MSTHKTLDDLFNEDEEFNAERQRKELEKYDSPEEVAKREERKKADFEKGVRLGWWDADGNPILSDEDIDEDNEDEDDETEA